MEPILSVEHLRRDYGGRGSVTHAVDDVSSVSYTHLTLPTKA